MELTLLHDARTTVMAQEGLRSQRDRVRQNGPRQAWFTKQYSVNGIGSLAIAEPIMFDCVFTSMPCFTSGVVADRLPDTRTWQYPLATVGVYKWVTEPLPVAKTRQRRAHLALDAAVSAGAHADVPGLRAAVAEPHDPDELLYTGAYLFFTVQVPQVDPTVTPDALPTCALTFHLSWTTVAMKAGNGIETPLASDPQAAPLTAGTGA